jgi:hypothetical protein
MILAGRIILAIAAASVAAGGLYDLLVPRLPANLDKICGTNADARRLVRELLRALGGSLVVIGVTSEVLVAGSGARTSASILILVAALIVPTELINALCMYRVKSPFYIPLAFALLALSGTALVWPRLH